jgi:hypothetical protein
MNTLMCQANLPQSVLARLGMFLFEYMKVNGIGAVKRDRPSRMYTRRSERGIANIITFLSHGNKNSVYRSMIPPSSSKPLSHPSATPSLCLAISPLSHHLSPHSQHPSSSPQTLQQPASRPRPQPAHSSSSPQW